MRVLVGGLGGHDRRLILVGGGGVRSRCGKHNDNRRGGNHRRCSSLGEVHFLFGGMDIEDCNNTMFGETMTTTRVIDYL